MAYIEEKPEQLGSLWVEAQRAKPEKIEEARKAGALADYLRGADPDGCPACGGSGRRVAK